MDKVIELLEKRGACESSLKWLHKWATPQEAWDNCENGSWLLWLLVRLCPKGKEYHQFILRVANRALTIAGADSTLTQAVRVRVEWCQEASQKDLEIPIVWSKDEVWKESLSLAWERLGKEHGVEWEIELKTRADDLRALFRMPDLNLLARKQK